MSQNVLFQCLVLDTQDPLILGRIRGTLLIDNYQDIIKGFNDPPWNEETDAWIKETRLFLHHYFHISYTKFQKTVS